VDFRWAIGIEIENGWWRRGCRVSHVAPPLQ
jgi:hypothetical protein